MTRTPHLAVLLLALLLGVTACTADGGGTEPVVVDTLPAPAGVTAHSGTSTSVHVMWNRAADGSPVTGYEVYQDGTKVEELPVEEYMVDIDGLTPSTRYVFTVRAVDATGRVSDDSTPAEVTTLSADADDTEPPTAPAALEAQADGAHAALLSWEAAEDDLAVTSYDILQSGAKIHTVGGEETTALVTGLRPETEYVFTVVARDAADNASPPGPAATVTTGPATGEDDGASATSTAPTDLTAEPGTEYGAPVVTMTWTPPKTGGLVPEYEIYRDGEFLTTLFWGAAAPRDRVEHSVAIEDPAGTTYVLKVRARLPDGHWGAFSEEVTVTVPE